MPHKPPLQHSLQPLQPHQLPPLINPHDPLPSNFHHHPAPIPLARLVANGVLIPRAPGGELDAVEDVAEVGAEGLALRFAEVVRAEAGEGGEGVGELVGASVGGVEAEESGDAGGFVRVGDD